MSKMSDMAITIEELRNAAAAITAAANWLTQQFSTDAANEQLAKETDAKAASKAKPALTLEQVRVILADKSWAGHIAEVI